MTAQANSWNDFPDDLDALNEQAIAEEVTYREPCKKCNGTGRFVSYSGRVVGACFTCKGKGYFERKHSPEVRAKARAQREAKKARDIEANAAAFTAANPELALWLATKAPTFEFAASLLEAVGKYGHLTERQEAAVRACIAKDEAKRAAAAERREKAPEVTVAPLEAAFTKAAREGLKTPALRLGDYKFSLAPETGRNAGAIYVKRSGTYIGKIAGGKFFAGRDAAPEDAGEVVALCSDPEAAAVAYGRRTGQCACCGRELTDPESIQRGIGPICASKYF